MKIIQLTNCCPPRKPIFRANGLRNDQMPELERFMDRHKDKNWQLVDLKRDNIIIKDQNLKLQVQNERILDTLAYLSDAIHNDSVTLQSQFAAERAKKTAEGKL